VSVVIVSYNTKALLDACLHSVFASRGVSLDVWVVDNGSPDGSADHVAATFPAVHLIRNRENRGFAAANNVAIARAGGRYVLLLNPDTLVREPCRDPAVGVVEAAHAERSFSSSMRASASIAARSACVA